MIAFISLSSTGQVVAADSAGRKIRVRAWCLSFGGTVNAKFQSHVAPTDLTGLFYGILGTQAVSPVLPQAASPQALYHFETIASEALDLNLSGNVSVGGYVIYDLVAPSA